MSTPPIVILEAALAGIKVQELRTMAVVASIISNVLINLFTNLFIFISLLTISLHIH